MDTPLEASSYSSMVTHIFKADHDPADIMNIMNITMRRFVMAAKMLPLFNEISSDGKMALLKSKEIKLLKILCLNNAVEVA